jgi:hypothetical protein
MEGGVDDNGRTQKWARREIAARRRNCGFRQYQLVKERRAARATGERRRGMNSPPALRSNPVRRAGLLRERSSQMRNKRVVKKD